MAQEALPPDANATCPVMLGEPVRPDIWSEHDHRRIYFCCKKCKARFDADPSKYLGALKSPPAAEALPTSNDLSTKSAAATPSSDSASSDSTGKPPQAASPAAPAASIIGRLHPLVIHFPIALILVGALCEFFRRSSSNGRSEVGYVCLTIGAIGAVVSAATGWLWAADTGSPSSLAGELELHRWFGIATAAFGVGALALGFRREKCGMSYRATLLAAAICVCITGHLGGTMVHGNWFGDLLRLAGSKPVMPAIAPPQQPTEARPVIKAPAENLADRSPLATPTQGDGLFATDTEALYVQRRRVRRAQLTPVVVPETRFTSHNEIDRFIGAAWEKASVSDAPALCSDEVFARRVYLDIIGVIPTIEEATRFAGSTDHGKRAALVDELLARRADYADHWTPFWEDALVSSAVGVNAGMATHGNYTKWIHDAFKENRPFDLFVAELLDPALPRHKPVEYGSDNGARRRVHYVLNESHADTLQTAAGVAQVFMGTAMKCAGCHSHFENSEWPQERFLGFASLFSGKDLELIRCEQRSGKLIQAAFPFEVPGAPTETPETERARLSRTAQLLVDPLNPRFAPSIVNRLWKRYMGLGLFEPADDYREAWGATHPELLRWLANDLIMHDYDLTRTIRLILTSRTYQLAYNPSLEDTFDVASPTSPRLYRSPSLRRLTAEQVIDSVQLAGSQALDPAKRTYRRTQGSPLLRALGKPSNRNDVSTARSADPAVLQALEFLNGEELSTAISQSALITQLSATLTSSSEPASVTDRLFLAFLSRSPTAAERTQTMLLLSGSNSSTSASDLAWAMCAGAEFQFIR